MTSLAGKIALTTFLFLNFSTSEAIDYKDCATNEIVYFSCTTRQVGPIYLCGEKGTTTINNRYLIYGKRTIKPEKSTSNSELKYNWYSRYQTEYLRIKISNNGSSYSIYRNYDQSISKKYNYGVTEKKTTQKYRFNATK